MFFSTHHLAQDQKYKGLISPDGFVLCSGYRGHTSKCVTINIRGPVYVCLHISPNTKSSVHTVLHDPPGWQLHPHWPHTESLIHKLTPCIVCVSVCDMVTCSSAWLAVWLKTGWLTLTRGSLPCLALPGPGSLGLQKTSSVTGSLAWPGQHGGIHYTLFILTVLPSFKSLK